MVDVISAGLLGKSIWWVCDHASGGTLSSFQQAALGRMRFPRQARNNHDLQKALQDAFPIAIESMLRSSSEDQQAYLGQIREGASALLRDLHGDFPNRLLDALLYEEAGSEAWRELWIPLEDSLDARETRPFFKASRRPIERRLQESFANVLRTDKHRRAVVAYQQAMLSEMVGALRDDSRGLPEHIATIHALQSVPDLINQSTNAILAAIQVRNQEDLTERDQFANQLNAMVSTLQTIRDQIAGRFILSDSQVLNTQLKVTCERVRTNLTQRRLVGREGELQLLSDGLGESAYIAVTGVPGAGKSSLLAHWIDSLVVRDSSTRVCSHFFSRTRDTDHLGGGMACIAEQLLAAHRIAAHVSEAEPERLKAIVRALLAMPHSDPLVVVLDGLDEITEPGTTGKFGIGPYWFPETLGTNVLVVFGIRFGPGLESIEQLRHKLSVPEIVSYGLDNLSLDAVRKLLNEPRRDFAEAIHSRTAGLANYVALVVDAVNQAASNHAAAAEVDHLPEKFSDYGNDALDDATRQYGEWIDPLGFMAAASGPLTSRELLRLCANSRDRLRETHLTRPPWEIARWLTRETEYWSFQHDAIGEARRDGMKYEIGSFRERLLADCDAWAEHKDPYSLMHYPNDLLSVVVAGTRVERTYSSLQALAMDSVYLDSQRVLIPEQPELPLQTVQAAILANQISPDLVQLTRLLFHHLYLLEAHLFESPLIVTENVDFDRALWLTSLGEPKQAALDYLLIGWSEAEAGHVERLDAALDRLELLRVKELSGWQSHAVAVIAAANVISTNERAFSHCCSLLDSRGLAALSENLVAMGHFVKARAAASTISDPREQSKAIANIAMALAADGHGPEARTALDDVLATAATISDRYKQAEALASIAQTFLAHGLIDEARELITITTDTRVVSKVQSSLVHTLIFNGHLIEARAAASTISDPQRQSKALTEVAISLAGDGQGAEAREVAATISDIWQQIEAMIEIVYALVDIGQIEEARVLSEEVYATFAEACSVDIADASRRVTAITGIARCVSANYEFDEALAVLHEARTLAVNVMSHDEFAHAMASIASTYESIAATLIGEGQVAKAREVAVFIADVRKEYEAQSIARKSKFSGWSDHAMGDMVFPEINTLTNIARHLAANGQTDEACDVAAPIVDLRHLITPSAGTMRPLSVNPDIHRAREAAAHNLKWQVDTLTTIAQRLTSSGQHTEARTVLSKARKVAATIAESLQRSEALAEIVEGLIANGQTYDARETAVTITENWVRAKALTTIAQSLAASGQDVEARSALGKARDSVASITSTGPQDRALTSIAELLASEGQIEEARAVASRIAGDHARLDALTVIAQKLATDGRVDEACEVAITTNDSWQQDWVLAGVVQSLANSGQIAEARAVAATITIAWDQVKALKSIAQRLITDGQFEGARATLSEAQAVAPAITDTGQRNKELTEIVQCFVAIGQIDEACAVTATISDTRLHSEMIDSIVKTLLSSGQVDEAHAVATSITDTPKRARVLADIVQSLVTMRQIDRAHDIATTITATGPQDRALISIAQHLASEGQNDEARAVASTSRGPGRQADVLIGIAQRHTDDGQISKARSLLAEAYDLVTTSSDYWKAEALGNIALSLVAIGEADEAHAIAVEIATTVTGTWEQARPLTGIATRLAANWQPKGALAIAMMITGDWQRAEALISIGQNLAANSQIAEARIAFDQARDVTDTISNAWSHKQAVNKLARGLSNVAESLADSGRIDDARAVTNSLPSAWDRDWTSARIARRLIDKGEVAKAHAIAITISSDKERAKTLTRLAGALTAAGRLQEAHLIVDESRAAAIMISDFRARFESLIDVANVSLRSGSPQFAAVLIGCAYSRDGVWKMVAEFADFDPPLATEIAHIAMANSRTSLA